MAELWSIVIVLVATFIGSFGPIFFKRAALQLRWRFHWRFVPEALRNPNLYLGAGLPFIGTLLFIPALKGGDVSVLYPLISTQYIWASLWSMKWLGERMNTLKWAGIALIIAGVTLINIAA